MTANKGKKKPKAEELFPEAFIVRDNIMLLCRVYGEVFPQGEALHAGGIRPQKL